MRYIDTGSRSFEQALGTWLKDVLDESVAALRCQTGFFGANTLGLFSATLANLQQGNRLLNFLVGSNEGTTLRTDVECLLKLSGPARSNRRIGVVSFDAGFFHPKTIHITRRDGSSAAYVGSANLTESGIASLHVEAGILLDARDGDDEEVLKAVANAIDWWFREPRDGLNVIQASKDLDSLVESGILDIPRPKPIRPAPQSGPGAKKRRGFMLRPLLKLPNLPADALTGSGTVPSGSPRAITARWFKKLNKSDAQRKPAGNQRGAIALTRAKFEIDAQRYFRHDFFAGAAWAERVSEKGPKREEAVIPVEVTVLGKKLGIRNIVISHAPHREAKQGNFTSALHLHPVLTPLFSERDMTDLWLCLERLADGGYRLIIQDAPPQ